MDGLAKQAAACVAGPADQVSHGEGQAGGVILLGIATSGSLIATQVAQPC